MVAGPQLPGREERIAVRHRPDHSLEPVVISPLRDGRPIPEGAEVLSREGDGPVYDVVGAGASGKGPAKVNSGEYRDSWDRIFGGGRGRDLN